MLQFRPEPVSLPVFSNFGNRQLDRNHCRQLLARFFRQLRRVSPKAGSLARKIGRRIYATAFSCIVKQSRPAYGYAHNGRGQFTTGRLMVSFKTAGRLRRIGFATWRRSHAESCFCLELCVDAHPPIRGARRTSVAASGRKKRDNVAGMTLHMCLRRCRLVLCLADHRRHSGDVLFRNLSPFDVSRFRISFNIVSFSSISMNSERGVCIRARTASAIPADTASRSSSSCMSFSMPWATKLFTEAP